MNNNFLKKAIFSLILLTAGAYNTFAINAADSDLSNSAGSNSGKNHAGMYIAICLFLVLAAVIPFFEKRKKNI
jgi:hypothetical protein